MNGDDDNSAITTLHDLFRGCKLSAEFSISGLTLSDAAAALDKDGRTAVLGVLKRAGVNKLADRQAIVTALAKASRAGRLEPSQAEAAAQPDATAPAAAAAGLVPVSGTDAAASALQTLQMPQEKDSAGTKETAATAAATVPTFRTARGPLGRKPRIALLHGGHTNSEIFKMQLARLLPTLSQLAEIIHLDGGEAAPDGQLNDMMRKFFGEQQLLRQYTTTAFDERDGWLWYPQLDEAIPRVERALQVLGPIDFCLGFSQGANFAAMLAARAALVSPAGDAAAAAAATKMAAEGPSPLPPFYGVILLEPDLPGWARQKPELFSVHHPLPVPALIVGATKHASYGKAPAAEIDTAADRVASFFAAPRNVRFPEGHRPLPAGKESCKEVVDAITAFIEEHSTSGVALGARGGHEGVTNTP